MATGVIPNYNAVTTYTLNWIGTNASLSRQSIRKVGCIVFMQLVISWTDISSDERIAILPTEIRPKYTVEARFASDSSNLTVNFGIGVNGNVSINSGGVTGSGNARINIIYATV